MSNGIIQTALTGLPLELEYRRHTVHDHCSTLAEQYTDTTPPLQQPAQTWSDEFACLLSAI
jgi:hypothetical protein